MGDCAQSKIIFGFRVGDAKKISHYKCQWEQTHYAYPSIPKTQDYLSPEWEQWRQDVKEWESKFSVIVVPMGYHDDCEWYVTLPSHCLHGDWDSAKEIDLTLFNQEFNVELLKEFCKKLNIDWHEPKWYLLSFL